MTDLDMHARKLLDFIEQSVTEALADPASRQGLLSEADGAFRVLKRLLLREEDHTKLAKVMLVSGIDFELARHGTDTPEANATLRAELTEILKARMVFRDQELAAE